MTVARLKVNRQRSMSKWIYLGTGLLALVSGLGCSDGRPVRVPISGTVTIDGEPVTRGSIKFVPDNGRPSSGQINADGRFTLTCYDGNDGALPGKHRVQ